MLKSEVLRKQIAREHVEKHWKTRDGILLYSQSWCPATRSKGIILLIHDLGEHSSCYTDWASQLATQGYQVLAPDLRGHGRSEGTRGHLAHLNGVLNDLLQITESLREEYPETPLFLYGQGMGAMLGLNMLIRTPLALGGIVCSAPWLALSHEPNRLAQFLITAASKLMPRIRIQSPVHPQLQSGDLRTVRAYQKDPMCQHTLSCRFFTELQSAAAQAALSKYKINIPLLVMHGSNDDFTSCKASGEFVRNTSRKTRFIEWQGGYHALHTGCMQEEVLQSVIDWLNQQSSDAIKTTAHDSIANPGSGFRA